MLEKEFLDYGFSKEDYKNIRESRSLINIKDDTLLGHFRLTNNFFENNGYTKKEIIKMAKISSAIYSHSIENIKQK